MNRHLDIHSQPRKGTIAVLMAMVEGNSDGYFQQETENLTNTNHNRKIKVLLVDDHQMMREGLRKIIEEEGDITIIAEAASGEEAIELTRKHSPDVIVMDVNMPGMNGIEATRKILSSIPDVRIIGLSLHDSKDVATAMKSAGASAYLSKTEATQDLCDTIRNKM